MAELIMLGTGNAMVTRCYNTCFVLRTERGALLVDGGGGNTILSRMEQAQVDWNSIKALYITHAHTDHIMGCIWVIRKMNTLIKKGVYAEEFPIYSQAENLEFLQSCCKFMINGKLSDKIRFCPIKDGSEIQVADLELTAMDIHSKKKAQLGFTARISEEGKEISLVCFGDEPCPPSCESFAKNADWMLTEAFCLKREADIWKPYEISHSTAYDAGVLAQELGVKNLVLYHTEDTDLEHRKEAYGAEAKAHFRGNVYVPEDLEKICL